MPEPVLIQPRIPIKKYLLGSASPRRQQLLGGLDISFEVVKISTEEIYPNDLFPEDVATFLAKKKSDAFRDLREDEVLITADTIVILGEEVLEKPVDFDDAVRMVTELSGNKHTVVTGVCLRSSNNQLVFNEKTDVFFRHLDEDEIRYYISKYKPYDKAGSYGVQEWIGYTSIKRLEGCYYNVMGLPMQSLYKALCEFQ
ncbi:MAG: septum formation protein Maf [Bacteroidetes bacterium]|nr:septum formation protein Maf [Bacteroidota bacterium]